GTVGTVGSTGNELADGCAITSSDFSCKTVARLNSGASRTYHLTLAVASGYRLDVGTSLANTVSVTTDPNGNDPSPTNCATPNNNCVTDSNTVTAKSDLELVSKSDGASSVFAGTSTTYTITLKNNGPTDEPAGIKVADVLPAGTSFVSAGAGCAYDGPSTTVTCTTALRLNNGASTSFTVTLAVASGYRLDVGPSTTPVNTVTNTASIRLDPNANDPDLSNNSKSDQDGVAAKSDLELVSKSDSASSVFAGTSTTYTITLRNNGPSDEPAGIKVADVLPAGTSFVSAGAGCAYDGPTT